MAVSFNPKVAVLILTHNHESYIAACLTSVIQSSLQNYHIWVLDDGSTDATPVIVEEFACKFNHITLIRQKHSGGVTSVNSQCLVDISTGEYIVLMSGDDLIGPNDGLQRAVHSLDIDPHLAVVIPRMVYLMDDPSSPAPECHTKQLLDLLRAGDVERLLNEYLFRKVSRIFLQSIVIRRSIVESFGGFDKYVLADDYAFVMRLFTFLSKNNRKFYFDENSLWMYRVHSAGVHRNSLRQFAVIAQVVAKYVPPEERQNFQWDHVVIHNYAQWEEIREKAFVHLGKYEASNALQLTATMMIKMGARAGNVRLISKLLISNTITLQDKLTAFRYLWLSLVRKFFG